MEGGQLVRAQRPIMFGVLSIVVTLVNVLTAPAALACSLSNGDGRAPVWVIAVRPDNAVVDARGNKAGWDVRTNYIVPPPSGAPTSFHVDALYIMTTASNWIEYGWSFEKTPNGTAIGPTTYDPPSSPVIHNLGNGTTLISPWAITTSPCITSLQMINGISRSMATFSSLRGTPLSSVDSRNRPSRLTTRVTGVAPISII